MPISKPYDFTGGTDILAEEVNANFDEIIDAVNNDLVWADGSVAFTGIPSGPASMPTTADQFARKAYVDQFLKSGHNGSISGIAGAASVNPFTTQMLWQAGTAVASPSSIGGMNIVFPTPFPNGVLTVLVGNGSVDNAGGLTVGVDQSDTSLTKAVARWYTAAGVEYSAGLPKRVNWIAIGW